MAHRMTTPGYDGLSPLGLLTEALSDHDRGRPRSRQTATGASQVDGCRAEAIYRLRRVPESDPRLSWQAGVGNAIHEWIATALRVSPRRMLVEQQLLYDRMPVTVDAVFLAEQLAIDWKSKGDSEDLAEIRRDGFRPGHIMQAHLAAAAAIEAGHPVRWVALLAVPRDGDLADAVTWGPEPYDESVAKQGRAQARDRDELAASDADPRDYRDEPWHWCRAWCPYVTECRGGGGPPAEVDAEALLVAGEFLLASQERKDADTRRKAAVAVLDVYADAGVDLRAAGVRRQGGSVKVTSSPDMDAVLATYTALVGPIPTRTVETTTAVSWRKASR